LFTNLCSSTNVLQFLDSCGTQTARDIGIGRESDDGRQLEECGEDSYTCARRLWCWQDVAGIAPHVCLHVRNRPRGMLTTLLTQIELVCSGEELRKPSSTVGCAIHMKIHESRATVSCHSTTVLHTRQTHRKMLSVQLTERVREKYEYS